MWKNRARLKAIEEAKLSATDVDLVADEIPVEVQEVNKTETRKTSQVGAPKVAVKETTKKSKKRTIKASKGN
tara:strand:+ start:359 stop:574 length:216 start_codon:yes stop_codon:yes gene_type:complete